MKSIDKKEIIIKLLKKTHLLSMSQIHDSLKEYDYSTVFRNMQQLIKSGEVRKVIVDNKNILYELTKNSHGHFICDDCGKVEGINLKLSDYNFKKNKVKEVTLRGKCDDC